ncbi:Dipeptidyl aminopeptidase/acylaminoacyl-peptidase-like protein [Rhizorhabdus wittichii RW1]|uniref:Dipeptidyl aminopeptidase/acylaminoacyl-peptidase-like protein n=1 Tax=Rhizorhabdus wittichii (strain DSM 6014 / CCUG 31198 / JCM 15750 / NBRC 105917 / EY 4224 / RW1) TaxID=392499 RepID=A0A9J9LDK5_RHIWR|nr:Dipeptidyl aminopeptidase/acylaminoacyl-peptidase-like protein [Rhizorhabdus wittichii RW1]
MSATLSIQTDLVYATTPAGELRGDLYRPAGDGRFPLLIAVPGGAWRVCNRAKWRDWGEYLAGRGYALFAIDYRTATPQRTAFPEAPCDLLAAIRHARGNASTLSVDPDRIGLFGASAGAHLAALAALAPEHRAFEASKSLNGFGSIAAHVKVLVGAYGIYDLFRHWQDDLALNPPPDGNVVRNLLGCDPFDNQQRYVDASPLRQISYAANKVSALIAWGGDDEFVNPAQSEIFVRALQQARFNVRTHKAVGASHFWVNHALSDPLGHSARFAPVLAEFLDSFL